MKKFVVAVPSLTVSQEALFRDALPSGTGWWHQIAGTWLIADPTDTMTTEQIQSIITRLAPNAEALTLEVNAVWWNARLKTEKLDPSSKWLAIHWET